METPTANKVHYACMENEKKEMQRRYDKFAKEYSIIIEGGDKLIIAWENDDITITPATGSIEYVSALKPVSELETKLRQVNLGPCHLRFQTKDEKEIIVRRSY